MVTTGRLYGSLPLSTLPPQMLEKSKKDEDWKKATMDSLRSVAKAQFQANLGLIENYEMVKGKFVFGHYFDQEEYVDLIGQLSKEFDLPAYLRHYDIISQVINTLSGEWQSRPDVFRVKGHDEATGNEYKRKRTDLLLKYVTSKIEAEVAAKMLEQGLDPERQDFNSPEEEQQYQQIIEQARQEMTPPAIEEYMASSWFTAAEEWGQHQLEVDRKRFKLTEKEKREFEDMCVADRCFRHFYLTPSGYNQETWNPVNVFFHKSPDIDYIEDGDYVGRIFYLTISDIIDRYGYKMTKKQIEQLRGENYQKKNQKWNYAKGTEWTAEYNVPFKNYPDYRIWQEATGFKNAGYESGGLPTINTDYFTINPAGRGYFCVVEGYWKSQKKIGKVNYIDPETGLLTKLIVDEDFIVPDDFTVLDSPFQGYDTDDVNTVVWTWVNETWKGVLIETKGLSNLHEDIYLDVSPLEFQFKGDVNPYYCKLPVCGQVFSPRNSQSMSVVDLMKPHQIGHNVAMNQAYAEMQKDYGAFLLMDVNMFPDAKDWGGEEAGEKMMMMAKNLGIALVDTSPTNTLGATGAAGGQFPREVNLDASARIISRMQIAGMFEEMALKQIGFNQFRLGQQNNNAPATSVLQGQQRSFAQTETLFTNFSNYIQRCLKMNLDIAQYVQSQKKDITITYVKSDLSRAFIELNGTDLLLSDLHVYVSNSQEEIRQLETLRELALNNNTSGATMLDLAEIVTANSPAAIKTKLKVAQEKQDKNLERQYQLQQQQIQTQAEIEQLKQQREDARTQANNDTKKEVAYINTFNKIGATQDNDNSGIPDALEYDKLSAQQQANATKEQLSRDKLQIERDKAITDREIQLQKLQVEREKLAQQLQIERENLKYIRIQKGAKDSK